ncbi:MAG: DUF169 domain-containing protein [Methanoregula sp.]|jgi:hypothetical protein|nr:DUF169 domain-containing protein [Methanoregula sp.]
MEKTDFKDIGARLKSAFRLSTRPLAVYGSEILPSGIPPMTGVNRCFAVSMVRMATGTDISAFYVSADTGEGCCPGGLTHVGFIPEPEDIRYFVSTGRKDIRGGAAEFLKASPELVEKCNIAAGPIHPPGKYLIVQACETLPDTDPAVRSLCCFGTGEQIRNMAALIHFDRDDPFSPVIVPWGSSCATFITFPAGLAENTPHNTAFMGPQDPTQNHSFPPEMMALGIPAEMAVRMVNNLDASFITRRPQVAFPRHR